MQRNTKPLKRRNPILQPWLICLLFAFWFYIIPAIIGIILLVLYYIENRKLMQAYYSCVEASMSAEEDYKREKAALKNKCKRCEISPKEETSDEEGDVQANEEQHQDAEELSESLLAAEKWQKKIEALEQEFAAKKQSNVQLEIAYLNNIKKLKEEMTSLKNEISDTQKELKALNAKAISLHYRFSDYSEVTSEEIKNKLCLIRLEEQSLIGSGEGVSVFSDGTKKNINDNVKQIIRCFNAECNNILARSKTAKIDSSRNRIVQSFESLNKIFEVDGISLSRKLLELKLDELVLVYACNEEDN